MYTKWYCNFTEEEDKERAKKLQKELMEKVMKVNNNTKEEIMAMSPVYGCVDESKDRAYKGTPKGVTMNKKKANENVKKEEEVIKWIQVRGDRTLPNEKELNAFDLGEIRGKHEGYKEGYKEGFKAGFNAKEYLKHNE